MLRLKFGPLSGNRLLGREVQPVIRNGESGNAGSRISALLLESRARHVLFHSGIIKKIDKELYIYIFSRFAMNEAGKIGQIK